MFKPTTIDDLTTHVDTERDALVAAAVLPHLPDDEALAVIRTEDERVEPLYTDAEAVEEFRRRVPCIGGASNLRRVTYGAPPGPGDTIEEQVLIEARPHSVRSYEVGAYDVDLILPVDDPDEYDFDDTDQTALSDFGVTTSVIDAVHVGIGSAPESPFERRPVFPV